MAEEKTKRYSLDKPLCQDNTEVQSAEYTDHYINGVTYRVWSAFEGKTNVADSLSRLMFRKLESGEQVGEVTGQLIDNSADHFDVGKFFCADIVEYCLHLTAGG